MASGVRARSVILSVGDTVLGAVLFFEYTTTFSIFINQITGIVYGLMALVYIAVRRIRSKKRMKRRHDSSEELLIRSGSDGVKRSPPWFVFVIIGIMNGSGNFFQAVGQPHTPGETQAGLNLIGIPLVLTHSRVFLKKRASSWVSIAAACVIFTGSVVTALPDILGSDSTSAGFVTLWYSVVFT